MTWLLRPLEYPFMHHALAASVLIGVTCAALGVHVVFRRMAFIGDAVAHTTLPGLVVAYLNQWNLFVGAMLAAVATALGIGWLGQRRQLREDTAIGVVFTGFFALGIVLISTVKSYRDFSHMLLGNILGVTRPDLAAIASVAVIVLVTLVMLHKELVLTGVDPSHARMIGLSPDTVRYILLILLALAVVTGIQAVGVVLTSALLITPAATASLLTRRLLTMIVLAAGVSILAAVGGLYASFYLSISSGGAIVLTCSLLFGAAMLLSRLRRASA